MLVGVAFHPPSLLPSENKNPNEVPELSTDWQENSSKSKKLNPLFTISESNKD